MRTRKNKTEMFKTRINAIMLASEKNIAIDSSGAEIPVPTDALKALSACVTFVSRGSVGGKKVISFVGRKVTVEGRPGVILQERKTGRGRSVFLVEVDGGYSLLNDDAVVFVD